MGLNVENMNKLADYIEALPRGAYDQHELGDSIDAGCGCICHYAGILSGNLAYNESGYALNYESASSIWMGTSMGQWGGLYFLGEWPEKFQKERPTTKIAAARIRHMIETGE